MATYLLRFIMLVVGCLVGGVIASQFTAPRPISAHSMSFGIPVAVLIGMMVGAAAGLYIGVLITRK